MVRFAALVFHFAPLVFHFAALVLFAPFGPFIVPLCCAVYNTATNMSIVATVWASASHKPPIINANASEDSTLVSLVSLSLVSMPCYSLRYALDLSCVVVFTIG